MQKNYFIARESSHYFGQINNIPYVERSLSIFFSTFIKTYYLSFFDFSTFSIGEGYHKRNILIIHQIFPHISIFVNFSHIILFTIFCVYSTLWNHGQGTWSFLQILPIKNIHSKTQETCIIIESKSYIMYNYFKPIHYVSSMST